MHKELKYSQVELNRALPLNYDQMREGKSNYIKQTDFLPNVYVCKVKNAFISPYGVVFKNGKVIKESIYSMFQNNNHLLTFYKKILLLRVIFFKETVVVCHNAFYDNYYHFTSEALPRLFLIKDQIKDSVILLPENAPKYIKDYIQFFDFKEIKYIKVTELAFARKLTLPMHTANGLSHRPELVNEMREWFAHKNLALKDKFKDIGNVYISRSKARWRRVLNEPEVISLLISYDFKVVHLEDLSVKEQISLFNNTKNLVGVHGAGLTNIIHMPAKSLFLSFIHETHEDPAFYNLAACLNHKTVIMECAGNKDTRGKAYNDLLVDIAELKNYLDLYINK